MLTGLKRAVLTVNNYFDGIDIVGEIFPSNDIYDSCDQSLLERVAKISLSIIAVVETSFDQNRSSAI